MALIQEEAGGLGLLGSGLTFTLTNNVLMGAGVDVATAQVTMVGGGFTLGSALTFSPAATVAFASWTATGSLSLAGMTFSGMFTLVPNDTKFVLVGSGTAGKVGVDVTG